MLTLTELMKQAASLEQALRAAPADRDIAVKLASSLVEQARVRLVARDTTEIYEIHERLIALGAQGGQALSHLTQEAAYLAYCAATQWTEIARIRDLRRQLDDAARAQPRDRGLELWVLRAELRSFQGWAGASIKDARALHGKLEKFPGQGKDPGLVRDLALSLKELARACREKDQLGGTLAALRSLARRARPHLGERGVLEAVTSAVDEVAHLYRLVGSLKDATAMLREVAALAKAKGGEPLVPTLLQHQLMVAGDFSENELLGASRVLTLMLPFTIRGPSAPLARELYSRGAANLVVGASREELPVAGRTLLAAVALHHLAPGERKTAVECARGAYEYLRACVWAKDEAQARRLLPKLARLVHDEKLLADTRRNYGDKEWARAQADLARLEGPPEPARPKAKPARGTARRLGKHGRSILALAAHPDGERVLAFSDGAHRSSPECKVWDLEGRGQELPLTPGGSWQDTELTFLFRKEGQEAVLAGGTLQRWDLTRSKLLTAGEEPPVLTACAAAQWLPGERRLASLSLEPNQDSQAEVWDVVIGKRLRSRRFASEACALLPGSPRAVLGVRRRGKMRAEVLDLATGKVRHTLPVEPFAAWGLPDERVALAVPAPGDSCRVEVWSTRTGKRTATLEGSFDELEPTDLVWLPKGKRALVLSRQVSLWDLATGKRLEADLELPSFHLAVPAGDRLLLLKGKAIHLWDPATLATVARWKLPAEVTAACVGEEGRRLVVGDQKGNLQELTWEASRSRA